MKDYSLTNDEICIGTDDDEFKVYWLNFNKKSNKEKKK